MGRERFSSRLGFILISACCAIGLGNVWRFPYIVGQYGGAAFVLIYAAFLVLLGLPIIVMEYSVGRASQKSAALSFDVLEPKGTKWHFEKWFAMAGNYVPAPQIRPCRHQPPESCQNPALSKIQVPDVRLPSAPN